MDNRMRMLAVTALRAANYDREADMLQNCSMSMARQVAAGILQRLGLPDDSFEEVSAADLGMARDRGICLGYRYALHAGMLNLDLAAARQELAARQQADLAAGQAWQCPHCYEIMHNRRAYCASCGYEPQLAQCVRSNGLLRTQWGGRLYDIGTSAYGRCAAVEVECIMPDSIEQDTFDRITDILSNWDIGCTTDGSITGGLGLEFQTSPAVDAPRHEQLDALCDALTSAGAEVNASCGAHVHVDARDMDDAALRRLARLWALLEEAVSNMAPGRIRGNGSMVQRCADDYSAAANASDVWVSLLGDNLDVARDNLRHQKYYYGQRYYAMNYTAWLRYGSIEFRCPPGSLDAARLNAWSALFVAVVEYAATATDAQLATFIEAHHDDAQAALAHFDTSGIICAGCRGDSGLHMRWQAWLLDQARQRLAAICE